MQATEQPASAQQQWTALHDGILTLKFAKTIPQGDRMSRKDAFNILQELETGPLLTDPSAPFKWWLFLSNVGNNTSAIVGEGIDRIELAEKSAHAVTLRVHRQGDTLWFLEVRSRSTKILE